jgi:hypothetical protein
MKPILSKINVFDGADKGTFKFATFSDIDKVAYVIFSEPTGSISATGAVYKYGTTTALTGTGLTRTFTTNGTLDNRHDAYYLMIRCRFTGSNLWSEYSDKMPFYCHSKPVLKFTDLSDSYTNTISYPSYSFDVTYSYKSDEGEYINDYQYTLYDENRNIIKQSKTYYYRDYMNSFIISGLDNHTNYFVRCKGNSVGGYEFDTGYVSFKTAYEERTDDTIISATNHYKDAIIRVHAECPVTTDTDITATRLKRRRVGDAVWTTLYEQKIDSSLIRLSPTWSNGYINTSNGQLVSDSNARTCDYISLSDFSSLYFHSTNYYCQIFAYNNSWQYLGCSAVFIDSEAHNFSDSNWDSSFASSVAYYRFTIKPLSGTYIGMSALASSVFGNILNILSPTVNQESGIKIYAKNSGSIIIDYDDVMAMGRKQQYEYAVAHVSNGIELGYVKTSVVSDFDGALISDGTTSYHILLEPTVDTLTKNRPSSIIETLGNKYPYLFYGSEANYFSGTFNGVAIEFNDLYDEFDITGGTDYRNKLAEWLTNGEAKVLKLFDGRRWLIGIDGGAKLTYSDHYDKGEIEFDFVEIGDLEDESDLYNNGLSNYNPEGGTT